MQSWGKRFSTMVAVALVMSACSSHSHAAAPTTVVGPTTTLRAIPTTPVESTCAFNLPIDAYIGIDATASAIGWAGNGQGVVTCLGGSFFVQDGINTAFGFGIYDGGPTTWRDADGYLPEQVTKFRRGTARVTITEFADRIIVGGRPYVAVYARVAIKNPTGRAIVADPQATPGLLPLATAPARVAANGSAVHDYVIAADRFGAQIPWPSASALTADGSFATHERHMRAFWSTELTTIAEVTVPDPQIDDAYRAGFIATEIARSGTHLNTGVNGYESEFSHDVIGILVNRFTQGDFTDAHALLVEADHAISSQGQYEDGFWTYAWPWAVYLLKTGDLAFVRANFAASSRRTAQDRNRSHRPRRHHPRDRRHRLRRPLDRRRLRGAHRSRRVPLPRAARRRRDRSRVGGRRNTPACSRRRTTRSPRRSRNTTSTTCRARWCNRTRRIGARTRRTPTGPRPSCSVGGRGTHRCSARRSPVPARASSTRPTTTASNGYAACSRPTPSAGIRATTTPPVTTRGTANGVWPAHTIAIRASVATSS